MIKSGYNDPSKYKGWRLFWATLNNCEKWWSHVSRYLPKFDLTSQPIFDKKLKDRKQSSNKSTSLSLYFHHISRNQWEMNRMRVKPLENETNRKYVEAGKNENEIPRKPTTNRSDWLIIVFHLHRGESLNSCGCTEVLFIIPLSSV